MTTQPKSPHAPVREDWLALTREEVLEPELAIVDPHHHLWDRPGARYLLDELRADLGAGHNVTATVFVECAAMYRADGDPALRPVGETEFVNGIAAMSASGGYGATRICAGIVGHADLRLGARVRSVLEAHLAASAGRFRGVRHIAAFHPDEAVRSTTLKYPEGLLADAGFREGFAALGAMGLTYDTSLYHPQLPELIDLARARSDTTIVLDHVGGAIGVGPYAGRRDEAFAEWRASIRELARSEQVVVKLGGLGMRLFGFGFHERERPPGSQELAEAWRPYVETCLEAFGPERCMFESNFPVDKGACSYAVLWNAFKRLAAGCSAEEKAALFRGTATRVYRLQGEQA